MKALAVALLLTADQEHLGLLGTTPRASRAIGPPQALQEFPGCRVIFKWRGHRERSQTKTAMLLLIVSLASHKLLLFERF
ncbi:hypothetical protein XH99_14385 [Bradyrhizobium nanningense]|uniref:Uncharacterized protein n=1 Tax=Bradyrhizobium nanningense TaxID=1325118 RepID=A0A4Q0S465_9BRAD|nr:hypothetical protein XH99_14385 [Bradyrhizobium nanningense]